MKDEISMIRKSRIHRSSFIIHTLLIILLTISNALAAPKYPQFTGLVVDNAHILSPQTRQTLEQGLADYQARSTNQVVIATVPILQGYEIEEYANGLFRQWQIGKKGKDNGVLLLIAPNEHRARIETGYGTEGTLTDTISNQIVQTIILPEFKNGNVESGVIKGAEAIVSVLSGNQIDFPDQQAQPQNQNQSIPPWLIIGFIIFVILVRWRLGIWFIPISFGGGGFGSGGSGFSGGGGGSSGGGGASGRW